MTRTVRMVFRDGMVIEIDCSSDDDIDTVAKLTKKISEAIKEKPTPIDTKVQQKKRNKKERGLTDADKQHFMDRLPRQDAIIKYIESLGGDYTHSLFDIHEHFFNRRFYSVRNRKNASTNEKNEHYIYTRFYEKINRSRKKIEKKTGKKWKEEWKYPSHKPKYKVWRLEM